MTGTVLQLGKNFRLMVGPTPTAIGGEQMISYTTTPDKIDGSSKDDGNYKVEVYGQQTLQLTVSGKAKLPDAGLVLMETARKTAGAVVLVSIENNGLTTPAPCFTASMSVGNFKGDFSNKDSVGYSFDLSLAAAPTLDSLFGG